MKDSARTTRIVLVLLIALGALACFVNRKQPLVRNSLVYARASEHVIEHGYDPRPVVADSALSYDKPILYAWFSAPFVRTLGNHDGLRVTSFLGTVAYLLAVLAFARAFGVARPALFLALCGLGPLVVYQFWSAHPDGWFAALVLWAWALAQRIASEPHRGVRRVVLLGAVIYLAILLKNYGLVLLASCPLYLVWRRRALRASSEHFRRVLASGLAVLAVLGVLVALAWTGHHPLSRLEGEGGGVGQYGRGVFWTSAKGTWIQIGIAVLLQFHVALAFALRRAAWGRELAAPLVAFGGVYIAGLMPFPTTFYNMRYFVPLFPLVALVLVRGAEAFAPAARRALTGAHAVVAALLIAVFNLEPVHRAVEPALPALDVDWIGPRLSLLDNLRMPLHREQRAALDAINAALPPGGTLYMLDVVYYRDAQQGVYERAGLIRADLGVVYVSRREFEPPDRPCYVWSYLPPPRELERLGKVTDLGHSLLRID